MSGQTGNRFSGPAADIGLLLFSAVLFTLSFPSFIYTKGFPLLAYIAFYPVFIVTYRMKWLAAPFYGLFYGIVSYALFNYWLSSFHPLTIFIVPLLYASYYFILFPVLKLSNILFPRFSYLINAIIWVGYEYLRTKGFLGYSYGIIGYSQYQFPVVARISALGGIWLVSFLVIFPSTLIGYICRESVKGFPAKLRRNAVPAASWGIIFAVLLIYSTISAVDLSKAPLWRTALIQQNIDPWQGGIETYRESLRRLLRMSLESKKENPDIIIWSETSFVPSIDWHSRYRTNPEIYEIVKQLLDFLSEEEIPYLIGNGEGRMVYDEAGNEVRVDYNSAMLYVQGEKKGVYRKTHLVPFTEHFPYKRQLPWLYDLLKNADTHFWEKGNEYTVFESSGVRFSTPICFEDTFGYISRKFISEGAQVIVNISNDSWSNSVAAEVQHMMHAVFRAAENRRSVVRSTNGGITCIIDPNGRIISRINPFVEDYLVSDVPVYTESSTLYSVIGDAAGSTAVLISLILLFGGAVLRIAGLQRRSRS